MRCVAFHLGWCRQFIFSPLPALHSTLWSVRRPAEKQVPTEVSACPGSWMEVPSACQIRQMQRRIAPCDRLRSTLWFWGLLALQPLPVSHGRCTCWIAANGSRLVELKKQEARALCSGKLLARGKWTRAPSGGVGMQAPPPHRNWHTSSSSNWSNWTRPLAARSSVKRSKFHRQN